MALANSPSIPSDSQLNCKSKRNTAIAEQESRGLDIHPVGCQQPSQPAGLENDDTLM